MIFNGASTLGPALAGFGVATLGYAGNFFLNGASFLGVLIALYCMRVPKGPTHQLSALQAIRTALGTVRRDAVLPWVLSGYAAMLFLGPSSALILPVYAVKILHIGPERSRPAVLRRGRGHHPWSFVPGFLGQQSAKRTYLLSGVFIWVTALTGFALSGRFWISMTALLVYGIGQTLAGTTTITLLQTRVPEQMRGRMMSLNTLIIMGVRPLGDFPAGALIAGIGAPGTVLLSASLVGIYGVALAMRPAMRST